MNHIRSVVRPSFRIGNTFPRARTETALHFRPSLLPTLRAAATPAGRPNAREAEPKWKATEGIISEVEPIGDAAWPELSGLPGAKRYSVLKCLGSHHRLTAITTQPAITSSHRYHPCCVCLSLFTSGARSMPVTV